MPPKKTTVSSSVVQPSQSKAGTALSQSKAGTALSQSKAGTALSQSKAGTTLSKVGQPLVEELQNMMPVEKAFKSIIDKTTTKVTKGPSRTVVQKSEVVEESFLPVIPNETIPEFQFNIYADKVYLDKNDKEEKIVFEDFAPKGVVFEVRSPQHPPNQKYVSITFEVKDLINEWEILFPTLDAQPNAFLNGLNRDGERQLSTMALSEPYMEGNKIYFKYNLDQFESDLNVEPGVIMEWNREEPLMHASIMIDGVLNTIGKGVYTVGTVVGGGLARIGQSTLGQAVGTLKSNISSGITTLGQKVASAARIGCAATALCSKVMSLNGTKPITYTQGGIKYQSTYHPPSDTWHTGTIIE